ncbi:MAG: FAD-dependent oxidoreductase [Solirubrobacterales bacterium]|nr:FAD-dependent oxidoreductase [Solirubrobacterales bacterium]
MSILSTLTPSAPTLTAELVRPGDAGYDTARAAWNLAIDQRPAAVAYPETSNDVAAAIAHARQNGLRVAAQGTGHNAGPLGSLADTLLVRTDRMPGVHIDPARRIARVRAGTLWAEVVEAAATHGLAALAGSSPDVGVVGYTLGGGLSWLGRRYGLAANHVEAVELVTADGEHRRVDHKDEPDLFWALRGGGGDFGVVTAIELRLLPITQAYAGILWYPIQRGSEVLHAWRELTRSQPPEELTTVGRFLQLPSISEIPEPVRGKSFVVVEAYHVGDRAQADELLAPLRALGPVNDTVQTVPMPALSHIHMDPEFPVAGFGDGMTLGHLSVEAIDALVAVAGPEAAFPLLSVEVRHLGGELGRARPRNGALASLEGEYILYAVGATPVPELEAPVSSQVQAVIAAMIPWRARRSYLNFAETQRDPGTFWDALAHDRLKAIKAAVDPDGVIRSNHPVE